MPRDEDVDFEKGRVSNKRETLENPAEIEAGPSLHFETLEPRLLLSADFLPVTGTIDIPGEEEAHVFTLTEATAVHIDDLSAANVEWRLLREDGRVVASADAGDGNSDTNGHRADMMSTLALASGTYTFSVGGIGSATGSYRFEIKDLSQSIPISSGTLIEGQLPTGRETQLYSISAGQGDILDLELETLSGGIWSDVGVRITDPFGNNLIDAAFSVSDTPLTTGILNVGGTYILSIEGERLQSGPIDFGVTLTRSRATTTSPTDGTETPIVLGQDIDATLADIDDVHRYSISSANPGLFLLTPHRSPSNLFWINATISDTMGRSQTQVIGNGDRLFHLPAGDNLLEIQSINAANLSYRMALRSVTGAPQIAYGDVFEPHLVPGSDSEVYRFDAQAGDTFSVTTSVPGAQHYVNLDLYDASGQRLTTSQDMLGRTTVDRAGTYYILVRGDMDNIAERNAAFRLDKVTDETHALTIGQTVSGDLKAGSRHVYTFDLDSATTLAMDTLQRADVQFLIEGPNGIALSATDFDTAYSQAKTVSLGAGSYRLVIQPEGRLQGDYSFRLLDFADAPTLAPDASISVTPDADGGAAIRRM
ncbi:MAG: LEPR-XLL domain-containing protein, partial [Pseudooceanicola atlanticus]